MGTRRLQVRPLSEIPVEDHGSLLVFTGFDGDGNAFQFGMDHRPASDIINSFLLQGEEVTVEVPEWAILSGVADRMNIGRRV